MDQKKIKVIVWRYQGLKNVGHAAMELSDGTYISWWPILKRDNSFKGLATAIKSVEAQRDRTLAKDKSLDEGEGRDPDEIVEIPITTEEEGKIRAWWNNVLADVKEKYHLYTNNCSTIVYRALREAGCFKAKNESKFKAWTPNMVLAYAKDCQKDKKKELEIIAEAVDEYLDALYRRVLAATSSP